MKSLFYQIRQHKLAFALNIFGLSIALASFYLFFTQVEFSSAYNHAVKYHERTYRIEIGGFTQNEEWSCYMLRPFETAMKNVTHVEDVLSINMTQWRFPVYVGENQFDNIMSTQIGDPGLDFFGAKVLYGTSQYTARSQAVVTQSVAERLFGTANAVGRTFSIPQVKSLTVGSDAPNNSGDGELEVIGVIEDLPANCLLSNGIYLGLKELSLDSYQEWSYVTYLRLDSPDNKLDAEAAMRKILTEMYGYSDWEKFQEDTGFDIRLDSLDDTYFSGVSTYDKGNRNLVVIILWSAIFVLIVALLNFSNFILAQAPSRIRGLNTRKVMGASTFGLRIELIAECVSLSIAALLLSALWVKVFSLNDYCMSLMSGNIDMDQHLPLGIQTAVGALVIGIIAGIYPAWFATSFAPALALKGSFGLSPKGRQIRTLMVCVQMLVGFALSIYIGVMMCQTSHIYTSDYGFEKDEVFFTLLSAEGMKKKEVLTKELEKRPWVESVAYGMTEIGASDQFMQWGASYEDGSRRDFYMIPVDKNYLNAMGLEITEGRGFTDGDNSGAFIVSESTANRYPDFHLGQSLAPADKNDSFEPIAYPIVGVCKDFQFTSLRIKSNEKDVAFVIPGSDMASWGDFCRKIFIRVKAGYDKLAAKREATEVMNEICQDKQHSLYFLDDDLEKTYEEEFRFISQVELFAFICILITLIGVFCLTMFETEYRSKEIAIRKVMGSSVGEVLSLFAKHYTFPLVLSFICAIPIGYYLSEQWLQNFAQHTPIYWWIFPLAFVAVSSIVIGTVMIQSCRVAMSNPVESLKSE